MKLNKKKVMIVSAGYVGVLLVIYLTLCFIGGGKDFVSNTTVNGINIGNMTKDEAKEKLTEQYTKDTENLVLNLSFNDQFYQIDMKDNIEFNIDKKIDKLSKKNDNFLLRGFYYLFDHKETAGVSIKDQTTAEAKITETSILDYSTVVHTTYEVKDNSIIFTKGQSGEEILLDDVYDTINKSLKTYDFKDTINIEPVTVKENEEELKALFKTIPEEGVDATLDKNNDYAIVDSKVGVVFDHDEAIEAFNDCKEGEKFTVKATVTNPEITKEDLEENLFKDVLGEYSTYVSGSSVRKNNVRLAGEKCNGVILLPGEEFSYNGTVGKRTKAAGFGEAGAYSNGETVQEVGGGVCQTSSTLYNAVVLSNLEVTERHNHTYISSYVPIGRDATVSWNGPDFKFKNNHKYPIKIEMSYSNSRLYAKIYGTNKDGISVEFTSSRTASTGFNTTYQDDPTLPEGTEKVITAGSSGAKAVSYRKVYDKNGNLISSEKEASSSYKGHDAVIARGTMKVEEQPAVTPETGTETTPSTTPSTETTTPDTSTQQPQ